MRLSNRIVIATQNREKFEEFQKLFASYPGCQPVLASELLRNPDKLKYAERHDTYLANAIAKARLANSGCHYPALADDSGLEVDALEGKPGVRSHRFATPRSGVTQDQANMDYMLKQVEPLFAKGAPTGAKFVCVLALLVEGLMIHATGVLEGNLVTTPRGRNGFGYDPIFVPKGSTKTLAEMTSAEKNAISHRTKALQNLMDQVNTHGIVLAKP